MKKKDAASKRDEGGGDQLVISLIWPNLQWMWETKTSLMLVLFCSERDVNPNP